MRWLRKIIYDLGFRPKRGSIFYSPSREWIEFGKTFQDAWREGFEKGYNDVLNRIRGASEKGSRETE